jgi:hypothetical protein
MKLRTILIMAGVLVAAGVVYFITSRPEPEPAPEPRPFVWSVEMDELQHMAIRLPGVNDQGYAWVKREDKYWYFDEPGGPKVDMQRWGGGIPLLMSGPGADRLITREATEEQLAAYGLDEPRMVINVVLTDERKIDIEVGDPNPSRETYYVSPKGAGEVYSVDHTWYEVLERLVLEPPYPK